MYDSSISTWLLKNDRLAPSTVNVGDSLKYCKQYVQIETSREQVYNVFDIVSTWTLYLKPETWSQGSDKRLQDCYCGEFVVHSLLVWFWTQESATSCLRLPWHYDQASGVPQKQTNLQ